MAIRKANPKAAPTPAKAAKADPKAKGKAAPAKPEPEVRDNRYLRASRIIIKAGEAIDLAELAKAASMSLSTAGHCREAFKGVTQALREAGILKAKGAPKKAPAVPQGEGAATEAESEPAAA
jgi:hypothetical protein